MAILQARCRWLFLGRRGTLDAVEAVQTERGKMDSGGGGGIEHLVHRFGAHIYALTAGCERQKRFDLGVIAIYM